MHQVFDLITPAVAWGVVLVVVTFTAGVILRRRRAQPAPEPLPAETDDEFARQEMGERAKRRSLAPSPGAPPEQAEKAPDWLREMKAPADEEAAVQPPVPAAPLPRQRRRLGQRAQGAVIWLLVLGILVVYTVIGFLAFGIAFDFERVLFLAATVWGIGVQIYTLMAAA